MRLRRYAQQADFKLGRVVGERQQSAGRDAAGGKATARDWIIVGGLACVALAVVGFAIYVVAAVVHALTR